MLNDTDEFSTEVYGESDFPHTHAEIGLASDGIPYDVELGLASDGIPYDVELGFASDGIPYDVELGAAASGMPYDTEIGYASDGIPYHVEIGTEAVKRVVKQARDSRMPAPRMRAVDLDAPPAYNLDEEWGLMDTFLGAAEVTGDPNPFPLTTSLMQRFGAGGSPRIVRVDTEDSYRQFRAEGSPEMLEFAARMARIEDRLSRHEADPYAHDVLAAVEEVTALGAEADAKEAQKRVEMWMPKRFDGLLEAWHEGENVCASIKLPAINGSVLICTAVEPLSKCVSEMARHASEANVPAATVVGILPAMGAVLGAGTAIKEMAAAAPSILKRPEAAQMRPFVCRIEPKANPALCALIALAQECKHGNAQACDEWKRLSEMAGAGPVKQAMAEALALFKRAAKA